MIEIKYTDTLPEVEEWIIKREIDLCPAGLTRFLHLVNRGVTPPLKRTKRKTTDG